MVYKVYVKSTDGVNDLPWSWWRGRWMRGNARCRDCHRSLAADTAHCAHETSPAKPVDTTTTTMILNRQITIRASHRHVWDVRLNKDANFRGPPFCCNQMCNAAKCDCSRGFASDPAAGAHRTPPDPLAGFKGVGIYFTICLSNINTGDNQD